MFTLVHWPNGPLMAATAVAAAVWVWVYRCRPNVYALALSMGLAAAALLHAMPLNIMHNFRAGPLYVQRQVDADREAAARAGESAPALTEDANHRQAK